MRPLACATLALALLAAPAARAGTPDLPADPERGRDLVKAFGCAVCHPLPDKETTIRKEAPDLTFEGDRVRAGWLFQFLRKPYMLRPAIQGRMPDFRLTEREALAIVTFMREGLRDAKAEMPAAYKHKPGVTPGREAGEKVALKYQCAQCHPGAPVGPKTAAKSLAPHFEEAARRLEPDWIFRWIREPQAIIPGASMPAFFYSDGEPNMDGADDMIAELRDFVVALGPSEPAFPELDAARARFPDVTPSEGRRLVVALNCAGCHPFRSLPPGKPVAPSLVAEGSRVQRAWVEGFLARPHVIKPEYALISGGTRMPSFRLTTAEAADIATYMERALVDRTAADAIAPAGAELEELRARGRAIFAERRCIDCHRIGERPGGIGPDLTRAGDRLQYGWVLRFVQNPGHFLDTRMPNLDLAPEEARAAAAYILGPKE